MTPFIPVVRFRDRLWHPEKVAWEATHPGWWDLMRRTWSGETVFSPSPTIEPHMIVNCAAPGHDQEPLPGLSGTLDFMPGKAHVILLSSWGALCDLVSLGERRVAHDWANRHAGWTGGILRDRNRESYVVGARMHARIADAPTFKGLMSRIAEVEDALRLRDADARREFSSLMQTANLPAFGR